MENKWISSNTYETVLVTASQICFSDFIDFLASARQCILLRENVLLNPVRCSWLKWSRNLALFFFSFSSSSSFFFFFFFFFLLLFKKKKLNFYEVSLSECALLNPVRCSWLKWSRNLAVFCCCCCCCFLLLFKNFFNNVKLLWSQFEWVCFAPWTIPGAITLIFGNIVVCNTAYRLTHGS